MNTPPPYTPLTCLDIVVNCVSFNFIFIRDYQTLHMAVSSALQSAVDGVRDSFVDLWHSLSSCPCFPHRQPSSFGPCSSSSPIPRYKSKRRSYYANSKTPSAALETTCRRYQPNPFDDDALTRGGGETWTRTAGYTSSNSINAGGGGGDLQLPTPFQDWPGTATDTRGGRT